MFLIRLSFKPSNTIGAQTLWKHRGLGLLLLIHLGLMAFLTVFYSPTLDESAHLPAGLAIWRFGRTDLYRVNPPLVRGLASLPVRFVSHEEDWSHYSIGSSRRCEWDVAADFIYANGLNSMGLFRLARWMCLPFSLLGLTVCWFWGRELTSPLGGGVAATLWCFSPSLLAHGSLLTNDVAATACGLLAAWRFQAWLNSSTSRNALSAGLCLGLALLTKTYWGILLGLWPLIGVFVLCICRLSSDRKNFLLQLVLILLIGGSLLNLGYGYDGTGTALKEIPFYSRLLSGKQLDPELDPAGNRFRGCWLGEIPVPFPRDYITGIDLQKWDLEQTRLSYLWGQSQRGGWWTYYAIGLGVKVPLGTWFLAGLGLLRGIQLRGGKKMAGSLVSLWLPVVVLFILVSAETGLNRHVRYVLPVLPLFFLLGGFAVLRWPGWIFPSWGWWSVPLAASLMSSLAVFPHSLSYFNMLSRWGESGQPVLIDSNLDWGQDLLRAKAWIDSHPECRPVTMAPVSGFPHQALGIAAPFTPSGKPVPGWHLISLHLLHAPENSYSSFRKLRPVGRVGSTINIYHVPEKD